MAFTESRSYVDERNGGLYVAGTRVSFASVVIPYNQGYSAEQIRESFPALTLEQIYGAIPAYLAHRAAHSLRSNPSSGSP